MAGQGIYDPIEINGPTPDHQPYQDGDGTWWDWDEGRQGYYARARTDDPSRVDNPIDRTTPPAPIDNPPGPGGGGDGSIGSLTAPFTEPFTPPPMIDLGGPAGVSYIPPAPVFTPPSYTAPGPYQLPSAEAVQRDPGFQFRVNQGQDSIERSAAAHGVLNTGGTLKDILDYGQNAASQEYQNVVARDLAGYDENYRTQYFDPYQFAYKGAVDSFAPQMEHWATLASAGQHQNDLNLTTAYDKWLQDYQMFRNQQNDTFDKIYRYATA